MADTWAISASLDKASYTKGETMTLMVSGTVTSGGSTTSATVGAYVKASDNSSLGLPGVTASIVTPGAPLTWAVISASDGTARVWTPSADGLSATAIA